MIKTLSDTVYIYRYSLYQSLYHIMYMYMIYCKNTSTFGWRIFFGRAKPEKKIRQPKVDVIFQYFNKKVAFEVDYP